MSYAFFAGGCFWCITPVFIDAGALRVECCFSGRDEKAPSYLDAKEQKTGHRETVRIEHDPEKTGYRDLVRVFLENVDPFDGIDRGRSYTLAVYYRTEEEKTSLWR